MKRGFLSILLFLMVTSLPVTGTDVEIQVPPDDNRRIEYIDAETGNNLGLFKDYEDFQEARLFRISEDSYVLEILYRRNGDMVKKRLLLSSGDVSEFRQKITKLLDEAEVRRVTDHGGRMKLITGSLALSLGYYGWALPAALDVDDEKMVVALYMLTGSAGFYLPYSVTKKLTVTEATATFSLYGGTRGILHGICLSNLLDADPSIQTTLASGIITSIIESLLGFYIANSSDMTNGTSEVIGTGGDFGIGLGLGTAHLAGFIDEGQGRETAGSVLVGAGLGMLLGERLSRLQDFTVGDSRILYAAGLLGAYAPLAFVDLSETGDERAYTASSMLGSALGLGLGYDLVKDRDFTTGEGNLVALSELAGGLFGLGIAHLLAQEGEDNSSLYLACSSTGAAAGLWLMYEALSSKAWNRRIDNFAASPLNVRVNPGALVAIATGSEGTGYSWHTPTLLSLSLGF